MSSPSKYILETYQRIGQPRIWTEAIKRLKHVKIVRAKSVKEVKLRGIKARPKDCYLNALAVCMRNPEVEYVEGFIEVHGVPLEHAWNCYKGVHFDVTEEALKSNLECPHQAVMIVRGSEAMSFAVVDGVSGPYLIQWLEKIVGEKETNPKK